MADLTLYHAAPSRSSIMLWMLEEVGEPYDIELLKLSEGDNLKPEYLAINPMGKVPALSTATRSSPRWRRSAPISPMRFRTSSSTCRSAIRAGGPI